MYPAFKNYTIVREIGAGGMSVVYEAIDNKLKRSVALKVLHPHLCRDPEASARFKREALAAARMDHPHIVRIYDYLSEEDTHCIAMEYVPGTDMESIRKRNGTVDTGVAVAVMGEIARAMAEAHGLGIIHRDIKPANILIHRQGRAMLTDFGLAHHCLDSRLTQGDAVAGTPLYMSPEQICGNDLSPATDVYSWAVTLYFLIAGKLPYASQEFPQIVSDIRQAGVVFHGEVLKALPPCYYELLRKCFHVSPAERIGDGKELKPAIERCMQQHPLSGDISLLVAGDAVAAGGAAGPERSLVSKTDLFFPARRRSIMAPYVAAAIFVIFCAALAMFYYVPKKAAPIAAARSSPAAGAARKPVDSCVSLTLPPSATRGNSAAPSARKATRPARKAVAGSLPAQADSGQLFIHCSPWAAVFIDDRDFGTTPFEKPITLPAGIYRIRLYNKYYRPREDTITVTANTILRKRYSLSRLE